MSDQQHSIAQALADRIAAVDGNALPPAVRETCARLLLDVIGLCVVARNSDYVAAALAAWPEPGAATVIGRAQPISAAGAAFVNGTAAHGEDFDDTFEGGPVHAGAVIVPAVLAVAEAEGLAGLAALRGIAVGVETICRLSLVVPKAVHKSGFHPTAVFGAMAAAAGVGAALNLDRRQLVHALGIAGSMAAGIIEYLADGSWTKRMHAGWAAQSGLRAALLARAGFVGPGTVFEGVHGLFNGFARTREGDWGALLQDFASRWHAADLAFKPYPCGTMIQPYVDCARRLYRRGLATQSIAEIVCEVGEGTVHRLWEPLVAKQNPANGYAGKFAAPYCIAYALVHGSLGLEAFADAKVQDERVRALAGKIGYRIDPTNPYPAAYSGHVRLLLADGGGIEERQPHMRGGTQEPLSLAEIAEKFAANARHGGWSETQASAALELAHRLWQTPRVELAPLR
ncbi:MAG TPA: MmgE/PrpD family protein [Hyphomicrobiaceae bacterium]|nr:MmgE/PrpD family protein [Hyphomicrobiaceae bacterium]